MEQVDGIKRDERYGLQRFAKTREEFIEYYDETFKDIVDDMEKERKQHIKRLKQIVLLIIAGVIVILLIKPGYFILPFFFGVPYVIHYYRNNRYKMNAKLKSDVIPKLVQFMHPSFTYEPSKRLPMRDFQNANFFEHGRSRYRGEDLIRGEVVDEELNWRTSVAFSEVRLINLSANRDEDGNTKFSESSDIVRGLFYKLDFNKDFGNSITTIVPRMIMDSRLMRATMTDFGKIGMKEVELESPEFMDEFAVYSNDQIMSRVILQPDTMLDLLDFIQNKPLQLNGEPEFEVAPNDWSPKAIKHVLRQATKGEFHPYIPYITFKNKNMYLLYSTSKDHFAFHMFHPFTADMMYEYFKDMNHGLQLIDDLNLNLKLYVQ